MEKLGRGLVAFKQDDGSVFISWRMIGTDPESVAFNLYRKTGANVVRVNENPIADVTWFIDSLADESKNNEWFVKTVINGVETESSKSFSIASRAPAKNYISIPLKTIEGYRPNDASVADLDGDGEYEIIVKWEARQYDNARPGLAEGTTKIDAYKLDGTFLWRIDLGPNIREGAHYTHFMVYDFDGDGKAELICKTAEGTVDGLGNVITDESGRVNLYADTVSGYILDGPEYFSVFDGMTGKELARENYIERGPREDWPKTWGDSYGNRMDRFLAGVGYFDGQRPSVILCRGYYGRAVIEAWNWREGELTRLWRFDSDDGTEGNTAYRGQGNHSLSVADVDGDGKDEIIYGAAAIDHDGKGLYTTGLGHGDALHVADHDPDRPGLEVFQPHESHPNSHGLEYRDARTGVSLWGVYTDYDVGRAIAVDIDPRHRGSEMWGVRTALYNVKGEKISDQAPVSMNFAIWWDGDLLRELLDKNYISKWDWENSKLDVIFVAEGCRANNGSKATPAISADIFGDWREEVIFPTEDNTELRIFSTTIPTEYRFYTFMHDYVYRLGVAAQNTGYNQPPHVSFFLGDGVEAQPKANIYYPN
ncbi:MAG: rhamnogalacturonan lyase [Rikenellaceae bacterium]|nr:rhamnogalacturonan lyase [Rikenellaceae bacterium]